MITDMARNKVDIANLQITDLGLFANPDKAIKLTTLHQSKGREFDAVILVHMNEGQLPHYLSRHEHQFNESRRLFYVGMTRAKKILLIASDKEHWKTTPTRYIKECGLL
jgi:DNA helicase-2/ATP-dependent DNA helicase PcrA